MNFKHLQKKASHISNCTRCGYCREKYSLHMSKTPALHVCPIRENTAGFEHHYARGKIAILDALLHKKLEITDEIVELFYTELDCKMCTYVCDSPRSLDPESLWKAFRQDVVQAGLGPPEKLKNIDAHVLATGNVFGSKKKRSDWYTVKTSNQQADVLFFAGCHASYKDNSIAQASISVLQKLGKVPAILGDKESCCGVVQFHDGSKRLALEQALHNVGFIEATGIDTVVTSCAECYKSFVYEYPKILGSLRFQVKHISQIIMEDIQKLSFHAHPTINTVTYHDPCHLGRYGKIFEQPRVILSKIPNLQLVEMKRNADYSWCCGFGADLLPSVNPKLAKKIAQERIREAVETEAHVLLTACPRCEQAFRTQKNHMEIVDFVVFIDQVL